MKVTVTFDAPTPRKAYEVLRAVNTMLTMEFNPGEWKRPCELDVTIDAYCDVKIPVKVKLG